MKLNKADTLQNKLFWLMYQAEGQMGLKTNYMEHDATRTGVDFYSIGNSQLQNLGAAREFRRLSNILFSLSKYDQHILCAWVATQPPCEYVKTFFGEMSWIAIFVFDKKEQVLSKICKDYYYNRESLQLKRIINSIMAKAKLAKEHAISSWATAQITKDDDE